MTIRSLLAAAAVSLALAVCLQAQPAFGGHYPAGVEGIKAGSLPPPGLYLRDYNYFYWSDDLAGGPPDFNLFAYVQAPRVIWISDFKVLGGYYGADVLIPFVYTDVKAAGHTQSDFGLGDIHVEPITLSWHLKQVDLAVGYAFWAPTGDFDKNRATNPGKGFWSHMFTAGATYYVDTDKTWALSALNRYEIHMEHQDYPITPGNTDTLEWGISKSIIKNVEVGLVGFYQQQTTDDSGPGSSNVLDYSVALGPEVNLFCSKLGLFTSLRYLREVAVHDRPEGNVVTLTLTKRW
jgi:hypothetical protein